MNSKSNNKPLKSPRAKSPVRIKTAVKKKIIKNTFDLIQFKKMLGKGVVKIHTGVVIDKKATAEEVKKIKDRVLDGSIKQIGMSGYVNGGICYVFNGVDRLLVINSISYQELKKNNPDVEVVINQYGKLTKEEIAALI